MPHTETINQTELLPPTWGASEIDLTRDQSAFAQKKDSYWPRAFPCPANISGSVKKREKTLSFKAVLTKKKKETEKKSLLGEWDDNNNNKKKNGGSSSAQENMTSLSGWMENPRGGALCPNPAEYLTSSLSLHRCPTFTSLRVITPAFSGTAFFFFFPRRAAERRPCQHIIAPILQATGTLEYVATGRLLFLFLLLFAHFDFFSQSNY